MDVLDAQACAGDARLGEGFDARAVEPRGIDFDRQLRLGPYIEMQELLLGQLPHLRRLKDAGAAAVPVEAGDRRPAAETSRDEVHLAGQGPKIRFDLRRAVHHLGAAVVESVQVKRKGASAGIVSEHA